METQKHMQNRKDTDGVSCYSTYICCFQPFLRFAIPIDILLTVYFRASRRRFERKTHEACNDLFIHEIFDAVENSQTPTYR